MLLRSIKTVFTILFVNEIKVEKDDSLRELLKGRKTKTVINTRQSNTSNAFEVLAQNALDRERKTMYYQ